ncbi:integrator complex subunit 8 [Chelonus insularis]|uniref:integrator complex subunit 8 n=1 Tax=Chelonus insularis TaxID=460826 RepID=UPI001589FCEA|nr:integrator complex subunit 8 [Chelonus insularis]
MMDVDLLRPGTVPISPDTILWFEFLLNPSLLKQHISKPLPDPSPTDLMIKFMSINVDTKDNDIKTIDLEQNDTKFNSIKKYSYKSIALKILSLKIGAFLKWDLGILEKKLPFPMQLTFLQDLFYITGDMTIELPGRLEFLINSLSDQLLFALVLYHRWHIRAIVNKALNNKQSKPQFIHIPGIQEPTYVAPALVEDILRKIEINTANSIKVLNEILKLDDIKPKTLTFETFQILTEDSTEVKQNWDNMQDIPIEEFKCQIHFDLATIYLVKEEYQLAKHHITLAKELFTLVKAQNSCNYCTVQEDVLNGYCLATGVNIEGVVISLTQQLYDSIKNQYSNILEILKADNRTREIPMIYRDNLELDIQGGLVNRKIVVNRDLLLKIQCLNLVRKIVDSILVHGNYITELKNADTKGLDIFFWALDDILDYTSDNDKHHISRYLLYLITMMDNTDLPRRILNCEKYYSLFTTDELAEIKEEAKCEEVELPPLLLNNDWGISPVTYSQSSKFQVFELERRLILSYDYHEIRELLIMLDGKNQMNPPWSGNSRWELAIPLQSIVCSLPCSLFQSYSYILLAKSRELMMAKNFNQAKALLIALEQELQAQQQLPDNLSYKLSKLISWELILVDIWQYYNSSINIQECYLPELIEKCKQCLGALQATDQVIPRQEVIESCTTFLLNMAEWDYLTSLDKRWNHCEFAASISSICQEIVKFKGSRKFPREAWDMLLVAFGSNKDQPQKRSSSNSNSNATSSTKDVMANIVSGTLLKLREPTALTVAISLLARLHNVLKDESSLELYTQYLALLPASISNANSYNMRVISEFLLHLLTHALKYHPTNVSWLRVMGDLNFILGYYESAIKYYLEAIMVSSDLFSQPVPRPLQSVYWRMIKCCAHLQCYTQATVLCQFLDEINYTLAFKMASSEQKNCTTADAMDAYYYCLWDTTILEYLIYLHSKRGEHHRKQLAIKVIGMLELNSNNNEEIQREAANIRKAKFFRALAKQYVY